MPGNITFVLGGAGSGKSEFAEKLAAGSGGPVTYFATADSKDGEMAERIARHRARRPPAWETWEGSPESLPAAVGKAQGILLLDCLTMWLTRLFLADGRASEGCGEKAWAARESEIRALTEKLCGAPSGGARLIVVSNEVGFGLVPPYAMGRRFRDLQGGVNQICAARAEKVVLVVAGCPLWIKG